MSRQRPARHGLAVLVLLAFGSLAAASPSHAVPIHRAQRVTAPIPSLVSAWHWVTKLFATSRTTVRGDQGSGIDPDGKPANPGTSLGYLTLTGNQGSGIDPDGHH